MQLKPCGCKDKDATKWRDQVNGFACKMGMKFDLKPARAKGFFKPGC